MKNKTIFIDTNILVDIIDSENDSSVKYIQFIIDNKDSINFITSDLCILEIYNCIIKKLNKGQKETLKETRQSNKQKIHKLLITAIHQLCKKFNITISYGTAITEDIFNKIIKNIKDFPIDTNDYINIYNHIIPNNALVITNDKDFDGLQSLDVKKYILS